jgi:hypothetical protein
MQKISRKYPHTHEIAIVRFPKNRYTPATFDRTDTNFFNNTKNKRVGNAGGIFQREVRK